jgi:two-component system cell cycle sensor histidine kinase/response regulator CckA
LGEATTVSLYLPEAGAVASQSTHPPESAKRWDDGRTHSVLLVDVEEAIRAGGAKLLQRFGYEVLAAEDGEVAVQVCRARRGELHAVILDLVMPGLTGAETFRVLHREYSFLKVLLSSGYSKAESAEELRAACAAGFVQKPFSVEELLQAIQAAIGCGKPPSR